jgi:hypothetical protein
MKYLYLKISILVIFILTFCAFKNSENKFLNVQKKTFTENTSNDLNWPWRGITILSHTDRDRVNENSIKALADKGVNLIRLRISFRKHQELNNVSKEESWTNTINWCKNVLQICNKYNLKVLISHSDFPIDSKEKYDNHSLEFWKNATALNQSIKDIIKITQIFDTNKSVVAFQYFAEPVVSGRTNSLDFKIWNKHFKRVTSSFRKISNKYLLYSIGPYTEPKETLPLEKPFDDPKIIYNFHFYQPHNFTHQGIKKDSLYKFKYPGLIGSKFWDKNEIEKQIDKVFLWTVNYKVKYMFVGEFSAVCWAEGREQYLKDVIEILEKKKFSWAYFALNGWDGWKYDYTFDNSLTREIKNLKKKDLEKTETEVLLEKSWGINKQKN